MITILTIHSQRGTHYSVVVPGEEARTFTSQYHAESYAEVASLVRDLKVQRLVKFL